jgi:aldose 1-epimerase
LPRKFSHIGDIKGRPKAMIRAAAWGTSQKVTLTNGPLEAVVATRGATLLSLKHHGEELTLNHGDAPDAAAYAALDPPYYGCVAGRVANRIAGARFFLDGTEHTLAANNGPNTLHGGTVGFDKREWSLVPPSGGGRGAEGFPMRSPFSNSLAPAAGGAPPDATTGDATTGDATTGDATTVGVRLALTSADGDEGFPGRVEAEVEYVLDARGALRIEYRATVSERATPINLTNHAYWNLSGDFKRGLDGHVLCLACARFLPVDASQIPTGERASVAGTAMDFRPPRGGRLDAERLSRIDGGGRPGLDHCFCTAADSGGAEGSGGAAGDPAAGDPAAGAAGDPAAGDPAAGAFCKEGLVLAATVTETEAKRTMRVYTDQPGVQVYTANFLPGPEDVREAGDLGVAETRGSSPPAAAGGDGGSAAASRHRRHNALCLETQGFPDAVNQPGFPSCILRPGQVYRRRTVHVFSGADE